MSRNRSKIDWELFEKLVTKWPRAALADLHIADLMKCDVKTLTKAVKEKYGKSISTVREQKEAGIRRTLVMRLEEQSRKGNLGATIWLTKNVMSWSEKSEAKVESNIKGKVDSKHTVFNVEFGDGTPSNS